MRRLKEEGLNELKAIACDLSGFNKELKMDVISAVHYDAVEMEGGWWEIKAKSTGTEKVKLDWIVRHLSDYFDVTRATYDRETDTWSLELERNDWEEDNEENGEEN